MLCGFEDLISLFLTGNYLCEYILRKCFLINYYYAIDRLTILIIWMYQYVSFRYGEQKQHICMISYLELLTIIKHDICIWM